MSGIPFESVTVFGNYDPAFAPVAKIFSTTVADGAERGAVCLRVGGRTVLDLWGGHADPETETAWKQDTLVCCFSVTKGVFALLAQILIDRGVLDPEKPVAGLWPEFGRAGKDSITTHDVLTHRAGLPAVDRIVEPGLLYDQDGMERALAVSSTVVPPHATPVYHNMTYGHLMGAVIARAAGAPVEEVLRREVTGVLGVDFRIGLSASDQSRTAILSQDDPEALFAAIEDDPGSLFARSMAFFARDEDFNSKRWRTAVIGSGNGHTTAAAIARLYEQFIASDSVLSAARRAAVGQETCCSDGPDPILGMPIRYGEGVELSTPPALDFGPNPAALGYWGAGGAQGFADPDAELSFGYVTGRMAPGFGSSPRARALVAAAFGCL